MPDKLATLNLSNQSKEAISTAFTRGDMSLQGLETLALDVEQVILNDGVRMFVNGMHLTFLVSGISTLLAGICVLFLMRKSQDIR